MVELVQLLRTFKEQDSQFYYEVDRDDQQQLTRLCWSSVQMQEHGARYGDVVLEDVTFCSNAHGLYLSYVRTDS
jgi:hypothetical protein